MRLAWVKNVFSAVVIASLTSGCIMYRLEELRHTTPAGTPFQNELSKLYMDFATQEEKGYDWSNSWHFADKGLMLAYGKDMGPEDLKNWNIPEADLPEMERARAMLMSALTTRNIHDSPSKAADAQFYFDCWVKFQEENWQEEEISYCRNNFMTALESLGVASEKPVKPVKLKHIAKEAKPVAAPTKLAEITEEAPVAAPPESAQTKPVLSEIKPAPSKIKSLPVEITRQPAAETRPAPAETKVAEVETAKSAAEEVHTETISYAVFFEANKAQLSEPGQNVISEVIDSLKNSSNYEVVLHVNSVKNAAGILSKERSQVVKKRLIEAGVSARSIKTSDSVSTAKSATPPSRRVEIFLNE